MVCRVRVAVEESGPYQLRVIVRDSETGRVGSANRFIQIPDLNTGRLALSGIVVGGGPDSPSAENERMALRRFQRGTLLNYALYIYNAKVDRETQNPQLETQVKLFRDGREVYAGQKKGFDLNGRLEDTILVGSGFLELGSQLQAGHYAMEYTVTDMLADVDHGTVSQWIDFEILN